MEPQGIQNHKKSDTLGMEGCRNGNLSCLRQCPRTGPLKNERMQKRGSIRSLAGAVQLWKENHYKFLQNHGESIKNDAKQKWKKVTMYCKYHWFRLRPKVHKGC